MAADELLLRQAPHSPQAEQAVLGSMLIDPDCIKDVMDKLRPEDFYLRANRDIFETIYHMFVYSRPIDGVTVAGEMEKTGVYNDNTRDYLLQLMDVTPTSANVMEYVQIVLDKSLMRQVASAAGSISAMVLDGAGDAGAMLEAAEQKVYAIRRGRSAQNMVPVSVVLEDVMAHLAELTASGGKTLPGLSTGLSAVDAKINGLNKSDLLLLAARPGMGKTSMALNVALSAARESGKTVAIFSLEMSKEQLVTRLIASEGLVENTRLVTGNLRESDWQRIAEAASAQGCAALDAPVTGGDVGAREARLSIFVGGDKAAFERAEPCLAKMGQRLLHCGPAGSGQQAKLANQVAVAGVMFSVCESLLFAQEAGLDVAQWLELVVPGAAGSTAMGTLGRRLLKTDYAPGFFIDHFIKDLGLCLEECRRLRLVLPGVTLAEEFYRMMQAQGRGRQGTQALIQCLATLSGKEWRKHE